MATRLIRSRTFVCGLVIAAGLSSAALAQDKAAPTKEPAAASTKSGSANLTPRFKKDEQIKFVLDNQRSVTNTLSAQAGAEFTERLQQTVGWTVTVKEVTDASTVLEMKLESLQTTVEMPQGTYQFDSTKPADDKDKQNLAYQALKPVVGTPVTVTLGSDGTITTVTGTERLSTAGPMGAQVMSLLSAEQIKLRWSPVFSAKEGGGETRVGQTWSDEDTLKTPQIGTYVITTTSTLSGVAGDAATVESTGKTELKPNTEGQTLTFAVKDSRFKRTTTWDTKVGGTQRLESEWNFTLEGDAQGIALKRTTAERMTIRRTP